MLVALEAGQPEAHFLSCGPPGGESLADSVEHCCLGPARLPREKGYREES